MPKFFIPKENISDSELFIISSDAAHITKVLRLGRGDTIRACDGAGFDYSAEISEISDGTVRCAILSKEQSDTEPNINVTLFQGIPKGAKMEYIIQKTTELGISRIVPCIMTRCVSKIDKSEEKKLGRWRKIAEEAAKQSGRGIVPEIAAPVSFKNAVSMLESSDIAFAPYECEEDISLKSVLLSVNKPKTAGYIIGPEGGFDPLEIELIKNAGISTITLGKRILRTETAGESVLSMLMYEIGDINLIRKNSEGK